MIGDGTSFPVVVRESIEGSARIIVDLPGIGLSPEYVASVLTEVAQKIRTDGLHDQADLCTT